MLGWLRRLFGGWVVGVSENKANSAKFKLSWGLACAEFGKSRLFG